MILLLIQILILVHPIDSNPISAPPHHPIYKTYPSAGVTKPVSSASGSDSSEDSSSDSDSDSNSPQCDLSISSSCTSFCNSHRRMKRTFQHVQTARLRSDCTYVQSDLSLPNLHTQESINSRVKFFICLN